jgi:hypothetical protein
VLEKFKQFSPPNSEYYKDDQKTRDNKEPQTKHVAGIRFQVAFLELRKASIVPEDE